ncbi:MULTISPECIES: 3-oxoacyl-[acyl-carrier-protein] synthase III C-terminal domain-containing protein [unclassified Bradyrhizobium]|uniref:3-oxoacyl-[acyl-carrier-protein] synthase III C-terminal domain-containing protein n=1 Tax=unclassified Bradyrhizobium TaxID=2631580 RepID=UPI0028EAEDAA|nr:MULTISPECIES: 3-oxoacyl-[acyl-carrier-protein] synthase III C-terminal domain-containing protein [unclassified Bradyrhizobium]
MSHSIDSLADAGIGDPSLVAEIRREGFEQFSVFSGRAAEIYARVLSASLAEAGLGMHAVGTVLFASPRRWWSEEDENALYEALEVVGFERGPVWGLSLQSCSALGGLLTLGVERIRDGGQCVLLLLDGLTPAAQKRADRNRRTVFSDGVASAILAKNQGKLEVLAAASQTSVRLRLEGRAGSQITQLRETQSMIVGVVERVLRQCDVGVDDIELICSTNLNMTALRFIAALLGVPEARLWTQDLSTLAHVYGCDNLIGLRNAVRKGRLGPGKVALLIGWSHHVASAVVVRRKE